MVARRWSNFDEDDEDIESRINLMAGALCTDCDSVCCDVENGCRPL